MVNDWYLARYEPIRDPADAIIGMLYIGELERLHLDERRDALIGLTLVVLGVVAFGFAASLIASRPAIQQIATLEQATRRFAQGDFAVRASVHARDEIGSLAHSFNTMAEEIERDRTRILEQKSEIEATNRNYLDMLGFVTHEFRGTLGAALFNVQLLEDAEPDELTEDSRELARLVGDALRSLDEITREYLELARIESGALVVNRKEVALVTDVIEPVMRDLQAQIRSRRMTVAINVPAALTVPADPTLLRVIYHNVVGNAVKYGAEGGRITLDHASETDRAVLSVWNEGRAIPADALPTLFRKFSRHDVDEATGRSGSGLGLFIVKQIVLGHGGEVWVESEEGRGTRLSFSIRTG
ncbi:MAG: HAMP domain-containing protein [Acidobacteria bacterium]|nr:HAMP domain-containing protein [Acidobacteriota bacterium]